nr:Chain B, Synthetic high affinity peptide [synthetic construct]3G03_B Chain B, High affinity synthetic peptide [synthetic construct]3G03_D Chain D, High affinity synthetic peptide [synthetic construct]3JZO_P Chain P, pDI peptide (12mer) [synthetic construct]
LTFEHYWAQLTS